MPATTRVPDSCGRFGQFGGRYIPETLTRALDELLAQYDKAAADPAFQAELDELLQELRRPAVAALLRPAAERTLRRGKDLSQARGPQPYRRPQDQQHARPGPAHAPHGQAAGDRGNRRRAARRGHRHGLRPFRPAVRRLHGVGGHPPPAAQRLQHEAAGGRGPPGDQRLADPPRRGERGLSRLDEQRRHDALLRRLGGRAAPLPADRPRLPVGHRPRGPRAMPGADRPPAGRRSWPASAAAATRRACSIRSSRTAAWSSWASRPAGGPSGPATMPPRSPSAGPACSTGRSATSCRTTTARPPTYTAFPPGWTIPAPAPSTAIGKTPAACATRSPATTKSSNAFDALARLEGILPALESSHALCRAMEIAAARKPDDVVVVCLSGRGDKDAAEIARLRGLEF